MTSFNKTAQIYGVTELQIKKEIEKAIFQAFCGADEKTLAVYRTITGTERVPTVDEVLLWASEQVKLRLACVRLTAQFKS
ncbi:MAG: hypothetical protein SOX69_04300 [Oscillospiraceae bacterium]|nr:hypothetical protein [Oscillospiraceae bacterium]